LVEIELSVHFSPHFANTFSDVVEIRSATSPHRLGGSHRLMCSRFADFAHHALLQNFLMEAKLPVKTSQSRRVVSGNPWRTQEKMSKIT
jgi:hypothetical protein